MTGQLHPALKNNHFSVGQQRSMCMTVVMVMKMQFMSFKLFLYGNFWGFESINLCKLIVFGKPSTTPPPYWPKDENGVKFGLRKFVNPFYDH